MSLTLMSLVSVSLLGQVGTASTAQTGGSCAAQTTSRLDSLLHPTTGSDERFFSRPNGAPNVLMVFDTSANTKGWQTAFPSSGKCDDADFMKDYDSTKSYEPGVNKATATGWPANAGDYYDKYFEKTKVYDAPSSGDFGLNLSGMGGPTQPAGWPKNNVNAACTQADGGVNTDCQDCLNTKGYYRGDLDWGSTRVIALGNALNYAPPRYLAVFQVGSQLVRDVQSARLGIIVSQPWKNSEKWGGAGAVQDICFPFYFWPSCNKSYDSGKKFSDSDTVNQRNSILGSSGWGSLSATGFAGPNLTAALLYSAGIALTNSGGTKANAFPVAATWPTSSKFEEKSGANQKSWCDACVYSAVIYVNASYVDETLDSGGLVIPPFASTISGLPASTCDVTAMPNRCASFSDEIAGWLYRNDFRGDLGGTQRISTYVVDMSGGSATGDLMRSIAKQGGGRYFAARNNVKLKAAILEALDDISNRGQTFATSAVTSIQTGSLQLTQMVPRMYPQRGLPWSGELYRYAQKNEFVDEVDLNGDGDKIDVFAVDKDGDPVVETGDGFFMKAYSFSDLTPIGGTQADGGVAALLDGGIGTARPFWEAASALRTKHWNNRVVWTVVDRDDGRGSFTHEDGYVRFQKSNWEELGKLMGLELPNCPGSVTDDGLILQSLNLSQLNASLLLGMVMPLTSHERWELCVKTVIDYTRGRDLGDEDGDGDRSEDRASMMADIFHSSPIVVEPPPERFVCDLGLSNQCGRTLYASNLPGGATPLDTSYSWSEVSPCSTSTTRTDPYEIYRAKNRARDKIVVVGSNGGMLHVFNNGSVKSGTEDCSGIAWSADWNEGTGEEHWAFIPPTLVPKLQDQITKGHEYFVDGDMMVRDVWVDGSGDPSKPGCVANADGKKQWCEFHTMLVGAEGRGGQHYFGLELMWDDTDDGTNTASRRAIRDPQSSKPFRWVFPQPGTETSARFGKTLFTLTPKPPPIGPVIIADNRNGPVNRYGTDTREAWVVMVGGGWASGLHKGRGVYMIDAYWGLINGREDNLYWSAEIDEDATSDTRAPLARMTGSVVAPVAMVDYGRNEAPGADGFFDSAVIADTLGQLWVARFWDPGLVTDDPSDAVKDAESFAGGATRAPWTDRSDPGLVQNWFMGRAFEQDKGATITSDYKNLVNIQPFYYLPSVAIEPATLAMRAFVGSGNRYALLEEYSGKCRWDNPMACAKYGCDDINIGLHSRKSPDEIGRMRNQWGNQSMNWTGNGRYDEAGGDSDYCSNDQNRPHYHEYHIKNCDQASGGNVDYGDVNKAEVKCSSAYGDDGTFACRNETPDTDRKLRDLDFKIKTSIADATGKDRYYGVWVYGGDRVFVADGGTPTVKTFDDNRFTDRGGGAGTGDLVNVTATSCPLVGTCTGSVGTGNRGWFYEYSNHGMKTATGSAILASCVLWSSLNPAGSVAGGTQACTTGVATSSFFQGDFITGEPNCAVGFSNPDGGVNFRGMERAVLTPPPEPATVVQISKSGQIRYSAQLPEPGKGQQLQVDVTVGGDLMQSVYTLPLSRSTHDCRHNQNGECVPVP